MIIDEWVIGDSFSDNSGKVALMLPGDVIEPEFQDHRCSPIQRITLSESKDIWVRPLRPELEEFNWDLPSDPRVKPLFPRCDCLRQHIGQWYLQFLPPHLATRGITIKPFYPAGVELLLEHAKALNIRRQITFVDLDFGNGIEPCISTTDVWRLFVLVDPFGLPEKTKRGLENLLKGIDRWKALVELPNSMTSKQKRVLRLLQSGEKTTGQIVLALGDGSRKEINKAITSLCKENLLKQVTSAKDGRLKINSLTAYGQQVAEVIGKDVQPTQDRPKKRTR